MNTTSQLIIESMIDTEKGIVMILRAVTENVGEDLQEKIAELLLPEKLFNKRTAPYLVLWVELKKFLTYREAQICVYQRRRAVLTIANTIYVDEEDNKVVLALVKRIVFGSIYREGTNFAVTKATQGDGSEYFTARDHENKETTAHKIAMRLKDSKQNFRGIWWNAGKTFVTNTTEYL